MTAPALLERRAARARLAVARRPWSLYLALGFTGLAALAAVAPGVLAPAGPSASDYASVLLPPSPAHPLGTDEAGRDLLTRVIHGAGPSLLIGVGAATVSLLLAIVLGTLAALSPRPVRVVVDRLLEILFAFPALLLALLLIAIAGPSAWTQVFAVGIGTAPGYARMVRGQILAAPTDSAVIQGRVAIDQAVRILEGKDYLKHVGPALYVIDESNIETFDRSSSLAPDDFRPTFSVD